MTDERCPFCNVTEFVCGGCKRFVKMHEVVDIFHIGHCELCGVVNEPCPDRTVSDDDEP